ncbi:MAG: hypothetical protein LBP30_08840, partial [Clostridiales Family XIII bacterium]|nr:hypothetical protein [Clostridiales Family XIII bacterium]
MKGNAMWDLREKKLLIVGLGRSGLAAARAAAVLGATPWGYDAKPADALGAETAELFGGGARLYAGGAAPARDERFDALVMSPGVPTELPFIRAARENGAEVIGEIEMAFRLGLGRCVAVTGTNGKTTTATLIGEMCKAAGRRTEVVGNIGTPAVSVARAVADACAASGEGRGADAGATSGTDSATDAGAVPGTGAASGEGGEAITVLELSSFQLETIRDFRPAVSVLLNVTPDHMDRHGTMERYAAA